MVKVGFICEGYCEKTIIDSWKFQELLRSLNLEFVVALNTKSNGRLLPEHIEVYDKRLEGKGAWKHFIITDSDKDTIEDVYKRINPKEDLHILIISVKKVESWFLSNDEILQSITNITYATYREQIKEKEKKELFENVEDLGNPYDHLKRIFKENTSERALDKLDIATLMTQRGFDITKSNCDSAKYFVEKLKEVAEQKTTSTPKQKTKKRKTK